jgi:hypothetical protein
MARRLATPNPAVRGIGTGGHMKVLTDEEVELVRELYEDWGFSYRALAEKFEVSKSHIRDLVTYRRR